MTCRANFGDERCGVDLNKYIVQSVITEVIDNKSFIDANLTNEDGYFDCGIMVILDENGGNLLAEGQVKFFINKTFELCKPFSIQIQKGMQYAVSVGCDKSANSCSKKFNNIVNFRGETHIPGIEKLYKKKSGG